MNAAQSINGDLAVRVAVDTAAMEWTASSSGTVWRKRVHLVGPAESGQVTSVVRYEPSSTFHGHHHPDGEEILVLDGVFSDEHGDWPAGTYLLNPEGFRHAPFSRDGVPTQINESVLSAAARSPSVVARRRPDSTSEATSSARPGSITGVSPAASISTLRSLVSTPVTSWPRLASAAAETVPT